ncbi:MAG TPA: protein-methionine-sulfoxide reductase heme-binding subunit MsrQ [Burkholderiales bacterium]|nr:protein-methionine-sulfoxide reductase heme-binding subunit MsrQ [Burkholderiales bacterium]
MTRSIDWASLPARALRAANQRYFVLTCITSLLAVLPMAILGWDAAHKSLGPNPLERLLRAPGRWALILLLIVLLATPLRRVLTHVMRKTGIRYGRRLADWNWMIRLRRPLGLASFFYAVIHVGWYVWLDLRFNWDELIRDLSNKPYIVAGMAAFLLLAPLAVTSTDGWMRRLKRNWKRLHFLIYPAAILAVLHFVWLSKEGVRDPYDYALALAVLLGYRIVALWLRLPEIMESPGGEAVDGGVRVGATERRDSNVGELS